MKTKSCLNIIIIALAILGASSMGMSGCQNSSPGASFNNIYPTADVPTPTPTTSPTGVVSANGSVTLGWTASSGATGYYVYYSTDGVNYTYLHNVLDAATSVTLNGLVDGTTYYFNVKAYNGSGTSAASSSVSAAIP